SAFSTWTRQIEIRSHATSWNRYAQNVMLSSLIGFSANLCVDPIFGKIAMVIVASHPLWQSSSAELPRRGADLWLPWRNTLHRSCGHQCANPRLHPSSLSDSSQLVLLSA